MTSPTEARLAALEAGQELLKQGQEKIAKDQDALRTLVEERIDRIARDNVKGCLKVEGKGIPDRDKSKRESPFRVLQSLAKKMFGFGDGACTWTIA